MFGSREGGGRDRSAVVADLRRRIGAIDGPAWTGAASENPPDDGRAAAGPRVGGPIVDDEAAGAGADHGRPAGRTGVLAVPGPLAEALPRGGVPRGCVVSLGSAAPGRNGATSLLLSLLAAPPGIWAAVVGMPGLGVLAAAELGVDLDRLGLIPDPGPDVLQVLSVLADGVDVIAAAAPAKLPPARQRVLVGRLRQAGTVLLVMGRWPGADLSMTVTGVRWSGIGQGHGRLRDREIDVQVAGRRLGVGSTVTLLLRSDRTTVTVQAAAPAARPVPAELPVAARAGAG